MNRALTKALSPVLEQVSVSVIIALVLSFPGAFASPGASTNAPRQVLIIDSFGRGFTPFSSYIVGFREELSARSRVPVEFHEVSLETARFGGADVEQPEADYIRAMFGSRKLDLVVPIGAPATRFCFSHRESLLASTPLLSIGIEARRLNALAFGSNETAIATDLNMPRMIEDILQLLPQTTNVAVVVGNSPLEEFWLGEARREWSPFTNRVRFDWFNDLSFEAMRRRARSLPPRSALFYGLLLVDAAGVPHEHEQTFDVLRAEANAPLFSVNESELGRGIVGGRLRPTRAVCQAAAQIAVRILQGESPGDFRLPAFKPGRPVYDWRELNRWGIRESRLPPGSDVQFRPPTIWEAQHKLVIWVLVAFLLQSALIAALLWERRHRHQAEAALRDSAERLRLLGDNLPLGVMYQLMGGHDGSLQFIYVSAGVERVNGLKPEAMLQDASLLYRQIVEADRPVVAAREAEALRRMIPFQAEVRIRRADGELRWVSLNSGPRRLPDGRVLWNGIELDITDRKLAEEELRRSQERFRTLTEAAFEGICIGDQGRILDANDQFFKLLGYDRAEIIGREVVSLITPEWHSAVTERIRSSEEGTVIEHPMLHKDGTLRFVQAQSKMIPWGGRTVRVTAVRDITERKRTEEKLSREMEFNRTLIQSTQAFFVAIGADGSTLMMNPAMLDALGWTLEEVVGRDYLTSFVPERDRESLARVFEQIVTNRQRTVNENRVVGRDGSELTVEWRGVPVFDGDKFDYFFGVGIDITERKRAEEALRRSQQLLKGTFASLRDAFFVIEANTTVITECNPAASAVFGYDLPEMLGRTTGFLHVNEAALAVFRRELKSAIDTRGFLVLPEFAMKRKDGTVFPTEHTVSPIELDGQRVGWVSVVRDITERKQAEEALRARQAKLDSLFRTAPVGIGVMTQQRVFLEVNEALCQMTGYAREEFIGQSIRMMYATQEDFESVVRRLQQSSADEETTNIELSWQCKDGHMIDVLLSSSPILRGDPSAGVTFVAMDITARRRAEQDRALSLANEQKAREEFTRQLLASQEAERRRIAGELHDSLGQNLLLVKNHALLALSCGDPGPELRQQLEAISQVATQSINEVRQISHDLRPYQLDHLGLTRALEAMFEKAAESSGIIFDRKFEALDDVFTPEAAIHLYRIAQECLNNVLKHSQARHVRIELERDVRHVRFWIQDDGRGFDVDRSGRPTGASGGLGLKNLAERVRILSGELQIESQPGAGTSVEVIIRVPREE